MNPTQHLVHVLIGDLSSVIDSMIKASALFITAALLFRFTERRTLSEFAPFDWIAAVAAGAIVGRAATASDTSWLGATAALVCLLAAHWVLMRLRFVPGLQRLIDAPPRVLIRHGCVNLKNLRRSGITSADLDAVLRLHGHCSVEDVVLATLESRGAISILHCDDQD